jgi:hypothetical protein
LSFGNSGQQQQQPSTEEEKVEDQKLISIEDLNLFELFGEAFEIDVKEGVVLIFPSFLKHCSKPNESKHTKTIISFNVT